MVSNTFVVGHPDHLSTEFGDEQFRNGVAELIGGGDSPVASFQVARVFRPTNEGHDGVHGQDYRTGCFNGIQDV